MRKVIYLISVCILSFGIYTQAEAGLLNSIGRALGLFEDKMPKTTCTATGGNWISVNGTATCCYLDDCKDPTNCCATSCREALDQIWMGSKKGPGRCCHKDDKGCCRKAGGVWI